MVVPIVFGPGGGYDPNSYARSQAVRKLRAYAKENPQEFFWRLRPWPEGIEEESRDRLFRLLSDFSENVNEDLTFYVKPRSQEVIDKVVERSDLIDLRWYEFEEIRLRDLQQKSEEAGVRISSRLRAKLEEIILEWDRIYKSNRNMTRVASISFLIAAVFALFMMYRFGGF